MILEIELQTGHVMKILEKRESKSLFEYVDRDRKHCEKWIPFISKTNSEEDAENYILKFLDVFKNGVGYFWGIWEKNEIIGFVLIKDIDVNTSSAEIGYMIDANHEGKGIIKLACDIMIKFIFDDLKLNKIRICCDEENIRSRKFPEKYGFKHEGTIRNDIRINGRLSNSMYWGLLKDEYNV